LFSYCKVFSIDPAIAQHTPMKLMLEMLEINTEVEKIKSKEIEKELKKNERRH
jgi:hypothetical protein